MSDASSRADSFSPGDTAKEERIQHSVHTHLLLKPLFLTTRNLEWAAWGLATRENSQTIHFHSHCKPGYYIYRANTS